MSRLAILYAHGAVTPGELLVGLAGEHDLVFVVRPGVLSPGLRELVEKAGKVFVRTDSPSADLLDLKALRLDGIVTFSDETLQYGAFIADGLGLPFHSPNTADALTDKHIQRERLAQHDVPGARSQLISSPADWARAAECLALPVVVKPAQSASSRNTYLVCDAAEGEVLVSRLMRDGARDREERLVAEEYLVGVGTPGFGDYVSVESYCFDGRITHVGVTGKFPMLSPFRETGQFFPAVLSESQYSEVIRLTGQALRALDVAWGITHTEVKLTPDGPRIIEVNGRMGGQINELYGRALGRDMVAVAGELAARQDAGRWPNPLPGVHFQYYIQPPLIATAVRAVDGIASVRGRADILGYRSMAPIGTTMPTDFRTFDLGCLLGHAPSHEAMLEGLSGCLADLTYTFDGPDGHIHRTGLQLSSD